jgi:hypothetical protein
MSSVDMIYDYDYVLKKQWALERKAKEAKERLTYAGIIAFNRKGFDIL